MTFAANGQISTSHFEGAVAITQAEYDAALAGMLDGKIVTVEGGFAVIDPPEPEPEVAPEIEPLTIEQIRASTSIDRAAFCNGLADAGVITDAEAIAAARGEWPSSFAGFLDYLNAAQSRDAQITWASCVTVQRNHEFVISLAWWTNMTDAQVDTLFGIN